MGDRPATAQALGDTVLYQLVNDDVLYAGLGLSSNGSQSAQNVDTPPHDAGAPSTLNWDRAHARLKHPGDHRLPRLALGVILITLDCRAKVEGDRVHGIPDSNERVPKGMPGI